MNLQRLFVISILFMGLHGISVQADTMEMKSIGNAPANSAEGVLRPTKGMTMAQVEQRFGAPLNRLDPVGVPPITRWVYDRFTVYFENQYVIHSVVNR
jgi:hypothetical protein